MASGGRSCARCSTRASSPSWTCANVSTCWRRSPSWTNRRWTTPTTRSPPTRRCWSWTRRICARTARSIATTRRASAGADLENLLGTRVGFASEAEVAELEFRRAELRASHLERRRAARSTCWSRSSRRRPTTRARAGCSRSWSRSRSTGSASRKILEPVYEASSAWARLVAILEVAARGAGRARRRRRCWRASPTSRRTRLQAKPAALATWRQVLAVDPDNRRRARRDRAAGHGAGALLGAGRRLSGAGVQARRRRHRGPRRPAVARRQAVRRPARQPARGDRRLEAGPQPRSERRRHAIAPAAAALEALYAETGDVAGPGEDPAHAGALGGHVGATRKKILFRIADLKRSR